VTQAPFFVVGCPRSGTTLLRVMLSCHPRLAVPAESHYIVGLAPRRWSIQRRPPATVDDVLAHEKFREWDIDPEHVRARVEAAQPVTYPELIDAVFSAYATLHGKERWGDKTPGYVSYMPMLADMFPGARFVHIVRDGREAAVSMADWKWGPRTAIAGAFWWRRKVAKGQHDGRRLGSSAYLEVRYEDLVADPEGQLRRVCEFLDEEYSPEMLSYPERMARTPLKKQEEHLTRPPTAGLRDWRAGRSELEQRAIEAVCRRQLVAFGYPTNVRRSPAALAYAWLVRVRELARTGPAALRVRLSPESRAF
jgi:Sulfotransferase family